jgi:hypothetical protein
VREYLCEEDASEITDFEAECTPGSTGTSYTLGVVATGATAQGTPNEQGVYVFKGLPDGFYTLKQDTGGWCKAIADRVDSQSRVIVEGGGNTDVFLFQCNAVEGLPETGSGPGGTITADGNALAGMRIVAVTLGLIALPLFAMGVIELRKHRSTPVVSISVPARVPTVSPEGRVRMRFR